MIVSTSNAHATHHWPTRRRFLGTGLIAGVGTLLGAPRFAWAQNAAPFYKGMCYSAFPAPYDESTANKSCIFFGSDNAYDCMEPLWGTDFESKSGMKFPGGRNDLQTLKDMGVNLVRLYDWEPRNHHLKFLNYCSHLGIKVLAPVSNYFLRKDQGFNQRRDHIPNLIKSFSNASGTDYHPAIAGIIIGNEPRLNNFTAAECIDFTKVWVEKEEELRIASHPLIGHPVDFGTQYGGGYPAWGFFETLLEGLKGTHKRNLQHRLFLAPQPQNDAFYLFENAQGSGKGYVQLTHEKFKKPLLFTELAHDRTKPDYLNVVKGQLKESIAYGHKHPDRLLGICHFMFTDKVWLCRTGDPPGGHCPTEGSFGVFSHTDQVLVQVTYIDRDFTHFDPEAGPCINQQLKVDKLTKNPVYDVVKANYS